MTDVERAKRVIDEYHEFEKRRYEVVSEMGEFTVEDEDGSFQREVGAFRRSLWSLVHALSNRRKSLKDDYRQANVYGGFLPDMVECHEINVTITSLMSIAKWCDGSERSFETRGEYDYWSYLFLVGMNERLRDSC